MKTKKKSNQTLDSMEEDESSTLAPDLELTENSDLCQKLMERYGKSSATQHRHLCASASAMRTILQDEGLPFTPLAYFAATISAINDDSESLGSNTTAALSSFLSILLPLVPSQSMSPLKARDAVLVLVDVLRKPTDTVSPATLRSVIKSLEILMRLCDLKDWDALKLPFETILAFSVDKRPKVRKCAQACVEEVFKSFQCSVVIKKASTVILSLFQNYLPLAFELTAAPTGAGCKSEMLSKPEHLEVLQMLNVLKLIFSCLSNKVSIQIMSELYKLLSRQFSPLTRHTFDVLEVFFESSREEVFLVPVVEDIMVSLVSYISSSEKNPTDTVIFASKLLKSGLNKLHVADRSIWIKVFPLVLQSIAGLLDSETNTSSQAAGILKELINHHIDQKTIMVTEDQSCGDKFVGNAESNAVGSFCAVLDNILNNCGGVPKEHILAVLSDLFLKLGELAHFFLKGTVLKLAELAKLAKDDTEMKLLQECIGSAVIAMGPEKILTLIPVCFQEEKLSCSNIWLVPILKKYVVGASLKYFLEHIALLVDSLQQACGKVKKSSVRKNLRTCIHDLWDLLPAFCRYPTDTHKSFGSLAKYFIVLLKKDSSMHANISLALQELVNQNRNTLGCTGGMGEFARHSTADTVDDPNTVSLVVPSHYTMKIATRNIKVLASYSVDLLQVLTDVFFDSPPEQRLYLKEAIGCLASITEISEVKKIFISLLEKFQFLNGMGESEKLESDNNAETKERGEAQRCMIMEFASSLVRGANEDLINIIFDYIKPSLQATDGVGQYEAYYTLSRIFEEHSWFYSSRFDELMELLVGVKLPVDIPSLRGRFACFHILLVSILKSDSEKQNGKAFLILNEIILTLKDSNEELRKEAYDVLLKISSSLKNSSSVNSDSPHQKLFDMIMGYLDGASPSIMSGAVAALSLLIYKENDYCFSVPDLVPSVLALLQSKTKEVIKVVLGFVKVLVSCLQASDLQKLLPVIVNGVVPWSTVSRNHFRAKVIVILEIIIRKCGSTSVELVTPDKYKRFIKTVKEQSHGKTSSSHAEISDPKHAVSSRGLKRSHGELYSAVETDSKKSQSDQDKRGRRNNFNTSNKNNGSRFSPKNEHFNSEKSRDNQSGSNRQQNNRRDFNKRPTGGSREKTSGRNFSKPGTSTSKFHKHNRPTGRQQGNRR